MPTLIQNYKKQEASARLKKFYSTMSQAIAMSEIDNGPALDWVKKGMPFGEDGNELRAENRQLALDYFNKYLEPYIKYSKIDENPVEQQNEEGQSGYIKVLLDDGTFFYFRNGACADIRFDINGSKLPNTVAIDNFNFLICPRSKTKSDIGTVNSAFAPTWNFGINPSREAVMAKCKTTKTYCIKLLQMDGWEFKDDYPYKL